MHPLAPLASVTLASALAVACAAPHGDRAAADTEPRAATLLAPALRDGAGPLVLDGVALDELVRRYEDATGRSVTIDEAVPGFLLESRIHAIDGASVPARDAQIAFESSIAPLGLFLVHGEDELILTVPDTEDEHWLRRVALPIPIERVEDAHAHPALLVQTVVELPSTDLEKACEDLRRDLVSDVGELFPLPGTSAMHVLGTGRGVARRVAFLRAGDAGAAKAGRSPSPAGRSTARP